MHRKDRILLLCIMNIIFLFGIIFVLPKSNCKSEVLSKIQIDDEYILKEKSASNRTNVIILLADDLGYGDLSLSGHPTSRTPNIDLLAHNGRFLTNFYVTSPVCSPSRASLLTGRYQVRSGVYPSVFVPDSILGLPKKEITVASVFQKANYRTKIVGKWHLGVGYDREYLPGDGEYGFDEFYGSPYSHDMCPCKTCFPDNGTCIEQCWNGYVSCPIFQNQKIIEQPVYLPTLSDKFLNQSLEFITESYYKKKPFFLYLPFHHIHHPQFASSKFYKTNPRGPTGDSLAELDFFVGRILKHLTYLGVMEDTLIWFTSDNGPSLARHERGGCAGPLRCGKGTTWEGGIRVPSIIHWPNKIKPGASNALVSSLDIFPTVLNMADLKVPRNLTLDGIDVTKVLRDNESKSPRKFFAIYPQNPSKEYGPFAVIHKKFKAHFFTEGSDLSDKDNYDPMCPASHPLTKHDPPLLFDMYADPGERFNLAKDKQYQALLKEITEWRKIHMDEMQWSPPRTHIVDKKAQPCCTSSSCKPFPKCCDCKTKEENETESNNPTFYNKIQEIITILA